MRQAAERRKRLQATGAQSQWQAKNNEFNFRTNHANEIKPLNDLKNRYKQLSNSVMQDLYDIFRDVTLVEEVLGMTFPMFLDQGASMD